MAAYTAPPSSDPNDVLDAGFSSSSGPNKNDVFDTDEPIEYAQMEEHVYDVSCAEGKLGLSYTGTRNRVCEVKEGSWAENMGVQIGELLLFYSCAIWVAVFGCIVRCMSTSCNIRIYKLFCPVFRNNDEECNWKLKAQQKSLFHPFLPGDILLALDNREAAEMESATRHAYMAQTRPITLTFVRGRRQPRADDQTLVDEDDGDQDAMRGEY